MPLSSFNHPLLIEWRIPHEKAHIECVATLHYIDSTDAAHCDEILGVVALLLKDEVLGTFDSFRRGIFVHAMHVLLHDELGEFHVDLFLTTDLGFLLCVQSYKSRWVWATI